MEQLGRKVVGLFCVWKVLYDRIENSIGGYCMVVIKVIVGGSFYVNMESFYSI